MTEGLKLWLKLVREDGACASQLKKYEACHTVQEAFDKLTEADITWMVYRQNLRYRLRSPQTMWKILRRVRTSDMARWLLTWPAREFKLSREQCLYLTGKLTHLPHVRQLAALRQQQSLYPSVIAALDDAIVGAARKEQGK